MVRKSSPWPAWLVSVLGLAGGLGLFLLAGIPLWLGTDRRPQQTPPPGSSEQEPLSSEAESLIEMANVHLQESQSHLDKAGRYSLDEDVAMACSEYVEASGSARRADILITAQAQEIQAKRPAVVAAIRDLRSKVIAPSIARCEQLGYVTTTN